MLAQCEHTHLRSGVTERKKAPIKSRKKAGRKRTYTTNHFKWAFTNRLRVQKDILPIVQANDNSLLKCYNLMRKKTCEHLKFVFVSRFGVLLALSLSMCFTFRLCAKVDAFWSVFRIQLNFKVATLTASCERSGKNDEQPADLRIVN